VVDVEELVWFILQIVIEVLGEGIFAVFGELFSGIYQEAFNRRNQKPILARIGLCLAGCAVGGVTLLVWPNRALRNTERTGLSLVLSPLCVGWLLERWGRWRTDRGHSISNLATFGGGAAFAFGMALVRFMWAR
jgi:hypothetical protein